MRRGLLILVGGRPVPNLLSVLHMNPDLLLAVVSNDAVGDGSWDNFRRLCEPFCREIAEPILVDAFDTRASTEACRTAVSGYSDVVWTFNITCGTKIMSIGAFEAARAIGADCWYLNTNTRQIVTLTGRPPERDPFAVSITDYLRVYGRRVKCPGDGLVSSKLAAFVRALALEYPPTNRLQESFRSAKDRNGRFEISFPDNTQFELWKMAEQAGVVTEFAIENGGLGCSFKLGREDSKRILNGSWLELFVWLAALDENCFDDVMYSFSAPAPRGAQYEIDFAATYAGMLLVAECKTGNKSFEGKHIQKLNTVAQHLGGNFVGKVFVTNYPVNEPSQGVNGTLEQARQNKIVVVHGADLDRVGAVLRRECGADAVSGITPTFSRG